MERVSPVRFGDASLRHRARFQWVVVLAPVLAAYLLIYFAVPLVFHGFARIHVVQPIIWCLLIVALLLMSRYGIIGRLSCGWSRLFWLGMLFGVFQVACTAIAGLLTSFGSSPYSHNLYPMFLNFVFWGSALVAIEVSRAYLLSSFSVRHVVVVVTLVSLLYTLLMIPPARFDIGGGNMEALKFFGGTFLPLLARNVLTCFLALAGGPITAIVYRGILEAFEWFSPILPDLPWITKAFVETIAPVIGILVLQTFAGSEVEAERQAAKAKTWKDRFALGWVLTGVVAVTMLWFSVGALGFRPVAVVSGSMSPTIDVGDLAVVREVSAESIKEGDIIMYRHGNDTMIHRVIEERQADGMTMFITKGDANASPDLEPVHLSQIEGRVNFCIPKLGWVSMKVKSFLSKAL